jgi:DNA processing protein
MSKQRACERCLRRSWLVQCLGARFDVRRYDTERLVAALALPDDRLLSALGVSDVEQLEARFGPFRIEDVQFQPTRCRAAVAICRHDRHYLDAVCHQTPRETRLWAAPPVLRVAGDTGRLSVLAAAPAVAIVGTRRASDYGLEVARSLSRDLACADLPVLSGFAEGIPCAAHAGALEAGGVTVSVMPGGTDICVPASRRSLYEDIIEQGCAISELPCGTPARRWCYSARNRVIAGLARVVVVVEAEDRPGELMLAEFARAIGRTVMAVPGRVTSGASRGTHSLIATGAALARSAHDVLDVAYGAGARRICARPATAAQPISDEQARILTLVGAGADTLDRLTAKGIRVQEGLTALTELELSGHVIRGDGGRYLPSASP